MWRGIAPNTGLIRKIAMPLFWGVVVFGFFLVPSASPHPVEDAWPDIVGTFDQTGQTIQHIGQIDEQIAQTEEQQEETGPHTIAQSDDAKADLQSAQIDPQPKQATTHATADPQAEDTHEGEHETHGDSGFLAKLVNFLVLFGGLTFILRKPISKMLGQRTEDIRTSMAEAEESNKSAQKKLLQGQKRLDDMAVEVERINAEAEGAGHREKEEIIAAANLEVERLKKLAAQEIALLSQVGIKELKTHAADLATSLARESILKKIKPTDQASLIDKSIDRLDSLYIETVVQ